MIKLNSTTYKGIKYIRLNAMPVEEAKALKQTLDQRTLIKILKDDVVIEDCVVYSAYQNWCKSLHQDVQTGILLNRENKPKKQISIA